MPVGNCMSAMRSGGATRARPTTGEDPATAAAPPAVPAAGRPHPPKVEAQRRKSARGADLDDPPHHGVVHVATIKRMRMRDDDAEARPLRDSEPGVEGLGA